MQGLQCQLDLARLTAEAQRPQMQALRRTLAMSGPSRPQGQTPANPMGNMELLTPRTPMAAPHLPGGTSRTATLFVWRPAGQEEQEAKAQCLAEGCAGTPGHLAAGTEDPM